MLFPKPQSRAFQKQSADRKTEREWQAIRRAVLQRDRWRCRYCNTPNQVEVHHLRPRSLGREDSTTNCLTLCRVHHADRHAGRLFIHGRDANKALLFETP